MTVEQKVEACFGQLETDMHAVSLADLAREAIALLREARNDMQALFGKTALVIRVERFLDGEER